LRFGASLPHDEVTRANPVPVVSLHERGTRPATGAWLCWQLHRSTRSTRHVEICVIFIETRLAGACVIDLERQVDDRGFFARAFCQREFEARGLSSRIAQANISFNRRKGTIRGLHFQFPPAAEAKLVRCSRGAILDVIVDLRPESATYLQHVTVELTAENRRALYVPERFAHGYQSLEADSETTYYVSEFYTPALESGLSYADPRLAIAWPLPPTDVSSRDLNWRLVEDVEPSLRERMQVRGT
jgi:dTDP-4-dehydrorhamnose 3,5-epimerase